MTLSKQLSLMISLIFLVIFTINFYTNLNNIREYLQIETEIHAQDTATSLGISLAPYILDETNPELKSYIEDIFRTSAGADSKVSYSRILLKDRYEKVLVDRTGQDDSALPPDWFTALFAMQSVTSESVIDAGWLPGGTIYVTIDPDMSYNKLWAQAIYFLKLTIVFLLVSIAALFGIIRLVLRPLGRIESLALEIADGEFNQIEKLPWTTDIRTVAIAMNMMSGKIEKVISNLNSRLEESSRKLSIDQLTGLEARPSFETNMKQLFMAQSKGFVLLLKIHNLGQFASQKSSEEVDEFIRLIARSSQDFLKQNQQDPKQVFRLLGSEFALIINVASKKDAETFSEKLLGELTKIGGALGKNDVANIGGIVFDPHGTTAAMLAAANEAYEKACQIGDNSYVIMESSANTHDMDEWISIVKDAIDHANVEISFAAQAYDLQNSSKLLIEEAMSKVLDKHGQPIAIGTFISIAEKIDRIADFDLLIINKVINHIKQHNVSYDIAINLSFESLANNTFKSHLFNLLKDNADIAAQLVFSVTAYGAAKDTQNFARFIDFAHRNGSKVILKRYESRFLSIDELKQFKLDYIRLARIYTENIGMDGEKRGLVEAIKEMGDLLDIKVIAEAVESDIDFDTVKEIGLAAASR